MVEFLFQKRWTLGGILILLATIFEIHGSSIEIYADLLGHSELSDIVFGEYRSIRSDEWVVFTPFAFSQYFNNFSMISDIVRAAPTNMFMTYGQAVWHPAMIFRPAQVAYLFCDVGSGLGFFWTIRWVVLFLISFEFARLILNTENKLSILYAIMIAFSPFVQWWFCAVSTPEILAAGQGIVVCWKLYLDNEGLRKRFLYEALFLWCAGVYILALYPAWQVSFGYVFLLCLIAVSFQKENALKSLWRDKIFWLVGTVIILAPIVHAFYISRDMIELQMATEYPGRRFSLGGTLSLPFTIGLIMGGYGIDVILPFEEVLKATNNCEAASFFTMAPLGWLIFFYLHFKLKQKDLLLIFLFGITIFYMVWEFAGIPAWLAKISLLSTAPDNRVRSAIDFAMLIMLFRSLTLIKNFPAPFLRLILAEVIAILPIIAIYNFLPEWFDIKKGFLVFIFTSLSIFLILTPMNKKNFVVLAILMLGIGATVNPINKGVDVIYKMPVGQKISEIVQQEVDAGQKKSLWISEGGSDALNDIPIMYGAPTINSVNFYPVFERWKKIDPEEMQKTIYNRYAHINLTLTNEMTNFNLVGGDLFDLHLNVNDLPVLEVHYVFSRNSELENFSTPQIKIRKIFEDAGSFIYEVKF